MYVQIGKILFTKILLFSIIFTIFNKLIVIKKYFKFILVLTKIYIKTFIYLSYYTVKKFICATVSNAI